MKIMNKSAIAYPIPSALDNSKKECPKKWVYEK
jgi:hypothetical protein